MKLYCYKFYDKDECIIEVGHIVAKDTRSALWRLEKTLRKCWTYGLTKYHSYSFFEVNDIEEYDVELIKKEDGCI